MDNGNLAIGYTPEMKPWIVEDDGEYPGCKPELNVRKTQRVLDLSAMGWDHPVIVALMDTSPYGMGWGVGSLHHITDAEAQVLMAADAEARMMQSAKAIRQAKAERDRATHYAATVAIHICPHCGTFCDGDCQKK